VRFTCGNCGRVYVADDRIAGRAFRMRCKRCGHPIAVGFAPSPASTPPIAEESETVFGELSRELQDADDEPADADVLAIQPVPAPQRPPPAPVGPPVLTAVPAADVTPPAPRRSRIGRVVVLGLVALAVVGGGVRFLLPPASRSAPPVAAPPAGSADRPAQRAESTPPPATPAPALAAPTVTPAEAPAQEEPAPQPAIVPPATASANRAEGAKRAPPRAPAPAPGKSIASAASPARAEPVPAAAPLVRPRNDLPPRDLQQLQSSLEGYAGSFDGCVANARRDEPDLLANPRPVVLTMTVRPSGTVAYPTLDDAQLSGTALGSCLKRETAKLVFPESGGDPVRVRMPLVLGR